MKILKFFVFLLPLIVTLSCSSPPQKEEVPDSRVKLVPESSYVFPQSKVKRNVLVSGLKVYTLADESLPLVSLSLKILVGSSDDPYKGFGTAHVIGEALLRRARMDGGAFSELRSVGGDLSVQVHSGYTELTGVVHSLHQKYLFNVFSKLMGSQRITYRQFVDSRLANSGRMNNRAIFLKDVASQFEKIGADSELRQSIGYKKHKFKKNQLSLSAVSRFYKNNYTPEQSVIGVSGDFNPVLVVNFLEKLEASWKAPSKREKTAVGGGVATGERLGSSKVHLISHSDPSLKHLRVTYSFLMTEERDRAMLSVLEPLLRDGLERSGLKVDQIGFVARSDKSTIYFDLKVSSENIKNKIKQVVSFVDLFLKSGPVSSNEFALIKRQLKLINLEKMSSSKSILDLYSKNSLFGFSDENLESYFSSLDKLKVEDVSSSVKRYFKSENMSLIVQGSAKQMAPELTPWSPIEQYEFKK